MNKIRKQLLLLNNNGKGIKARRQVLEEDVAQVGALRGQRCRRSPLRKKDKSKKFYDSMKVPHALAHLQRIVPGKIWHHPPASNRR